MLFTFHYVSIKSDTESLTFDALFKFTFHYVSIKSKPYEECKEFRKEFTFHYVSIKSFYLLLYLLLFLNLHSTMFLLNQEAAFLEELGM